MGKNLIVNWLKPLWINYHQEMKITCTSHL